ncbi:MAG TPA: hypothetical protein VN776_04985 [Terracidiphilus sp.]|nr:hypothetical protein [Terracidiphilus sp.]
MTLAAHDIPMVILRLILASAGLACFYMAVFMYTDKVGAWQNRLVDLWVEIGEGSQGLLSAQALLVKKSSGLVTSGLNWLLGDRLVSTQVVAVSFSLSFASTILLFTSADIHEDSMLTNGPDVRVLGAFGLAVAVAFSLFGCLGVRGLSTRGRPLLALAIPIASVLFAYPAFAYLSEPRGVSSGDGPIEYIAGELIFLASPAFGVLCDLMVLIVNRFVLRGMAKTGSSVTLLLGFLYNAAWVLFLGDSVAYVFRNGLGNPNLIGDPLEGAISFLSAHSFNHGFEVYISIVIALMSNLFTLFVSAGLLTIVAAALAHRLFWPLAGRTVYALYQFKILSNKALQFSTGLALLLLAFPGLEGILKRLHLL